MAIKEEYLQGKLSPNFYAVMHSTIPGHLARVLNEILYEGDTAEVTMQGCGDTPLKKFVTTENPYVLQVRQIEGSRGHGKTTEEWLREIRDYLETVALAEAASK